MTSQRIFPFFINGQYWKSLGVAQEDIEQGYHIHFVARKNDCQYRPDSESEDALAINTIRFVLSRIAEKRGDYIAEWSEGFWITDYSLYIDEDGNLWAR